MGSQYGNQNDDEDGEDDENDDECELDRSRVESTTDGPYNETLFVKDNGQDQCSGHAHNDDEHDETPPETPSPQKGNRGGGGGGCDSSMIPSFSPFKAFQRRGIGETAAVYPLDLDQLYSEEEAACLRVQQDHDQGHSFSPWAGSGSGLGLGSESGLAVIGLREERISSYGPGSSSAVGPVGEDFTYDDLDGCRRLNNHRHNADEPVTGGGSAAGARKQNVLFEFEYEREKALRHEYDEYPSPVCSGANTVSQASIDDACVSKSSIDNDYCPGSYNAPAGISHTPYQLLSHLDNIRSHASSHAFSFSRMRFSDFLRYPAFNSAAQLQYLAHVATVSRPFGRM